MTNYIKASVAIVKIGSIEVEGLMTKNGEELIAIPQVCSIFQFAKNQASRDIKAILGKDFQFDKARTTLHPKAVNVLHLDDFERLVFELVLRGNTQAIAFSRALIGLSLKQLWSDAFETNLTSEQRQDYLKSRILDTPDPWERFYSQDFCYRFFSWFGALGYWDFCYSFLSAAERCKLDKLNPPINGRRDDLIHQYLSEAAKEQLKPRVGELTTLVLACPSKAQFLTLWTNLHGKHWQLELDLPSIG